MENSALAPLRSSSELYVRQSGELAELFGFESRNKYAVFTEDRLQVAYAAEQGKGIFDALMRQFVGHWRNYDIQFFDPQRRPTFKAVHPFRFFFQRLEVFGPDGRFIGALQQRFSMLRRRFDVEGPDGQVLMTVRSGFFSIWTFPFEKNGQEVAVIEKKWSGLLTEMFTDRDNFRVRVLAPSLSLEERMLLLCAAIFVDMQYFEKKAGSDR